jgi:hypothetical protein
MRLVVWILSGALLALSASATPAECLWFTTSAGGSSAGLAFGLSLSYVNGPVIYSARFTRSQELPQSLLFEPEPREHTQDIGLMVGLVGRSGSKAVASASIGVGYVSGVRRGDKLEDEGYSFFVSYDFEKITFSTVGLLLQSDIYMSNKLGLSFFGSVNDKCSYGGVLLTASLGRNK